MSLIAKNNLLLFFFLNPPQPKLAQIRDHWSVNKLVTIDLEGQTRRARAFWKDRQEGLWHFGRTDKRARALCKDRQKD